jgi:hypothetical protein
MQDWEHEEAIEEDEGETGLMVMLCGMVSPSATALGDE